MPRARGLFPVALSIQAAATALKIPARVVSEAVYSTCELEAHKAPSGGRVRILVRDLETWVRSWPRATIKRKISRSK